MVWSQFFTRKCGLSTFSCLQLIANSVVLMTARAATGDGWPQWRHRECGIHILLSLINTYVLIALWYLSLYFLQLHESQLCILVHKRVHTMFCHFIPLWHAYLFWVRPSVHYTIIPKDISVSHSTSTSKCDYFNQVLHQSNNRILN